MYSLEKMLAHPKSINETSLFFKRSMFLNSRLLYEISKIEEKIQHMRIFLTGEKIVFLLL